MAEPGPPEVVRAGSPVAPEPMAEPGPGPEVVRVRAVGEPAARAGSPVASEPMAEPLGRQQSAQPYFFLWLFRESDGETSKFDETVILLHRPPSPFSRCFNMSGRGCQQNDSLANG